MLIIEVAEAERLWCSHRWHPNNVSVHVDVGKRRRVDEASHAVSRKPQFERVKFSSTCANRDAKMAYLRTETRPSFHTEQPIWEPPEKLLLDLDARVSGDTSYYLRIKVRCRDDKVGYFRLRQHTIGRAYIRLDTIPHNRMTTVWVPILHRGNHTGRVLVRIGFDIDASCPSKYGSTMIQRICGQHPSCAGGEEKNTSTEAASGTRTVADKNDQARIAGESNSTIEGSHILRSTALAFTVSAQLPVRIDIGDAIHGRVCYLKTSACPLAVTKAVYAMIEVEQVARSDVEKRTKTEIVFVQKVVLYNDSGAKEITRPRCEYVWHFDVPLPKLPGPGTVDSSGRPVLSVAVRITAFIKPRNGPEKSVVLTHQYAKKFTDR